MSQRQFLPLDEDSIDSEREFDLNNMTAMDYLRQVRFERKTIPQVVTVHPLVNEAASSSEQENSNSEKPKEFHPNNPTNEWSLIQKEKFSEMQQRIVELRNDPKLSERLTEATELNTDHESTCIQFCMKNEPILSTILVLNQGQLEELIEILSDHLLEKIECPEFHQQLAEFHWITKWIYACLACLRSPLDPEVHNCLRVIAKSCIQVTTQLKTLEDPLSDSFLPWNLIIVVIAICFQQYDLLSL